MILGEQISAVPRADCYCVELHFESSTSYCYDARFFTKDHFLSMLPYILNLVNVWKIDENTAIYTHFMYNFLHPDDSTAVISNIAYIDNNAVFHTFSLSKEYIGANHPELLL